MSAYRGFFGSKPYSKANTYLESVGKSPINWCESEDVWHTYVFQSHGHAAPALLVLILAQFVLLKFLYSPASTSNTPHIGEQQMNHRIANHNQMPHSQITQPTHQAA
jgi:hypothetical protein